MGRFSKSVRERTCKNIELLEALLAKVPDEQTGLERHINGIFYSEQTLEREAESMEEFAKDLKNGDVIVKDGTWLNRKGQH